LAGTVDELRGGITSVFYAVFRILQFLLSTGSIREDRHHAIQDGAGQGATQLLAESIGKDELRSPYTLLTGIEVGERVVGLGVDTDNCKSVKTTWNRFRS
jgi:hypothetical protein